MLKKRIIARLDIKGPNVVKGIHMEGLRVMGDPIMLAQKYADQGAHELLYIDTVASLYGRNQLLELVAKTADAIFIPITVGGGISTVGQVRELLNAGADKVAINTYALHHPEFIQELAGQFGSQAICVSIQAKRVPGGWEAYTECGREKTGKNAIEWAHQSAELGAGELLITSIDRDGTLNGFDTALYEKIQVPVQVVAAGGMGKLADVDILKHGADAIACASCLHYNKLTIGEIDELANQKQLFYEKSCVAGRAA